MGLQQIELKKKKLERVLSDLNLMCKQEGVKKQYELVEKDNTA